MKKNYLFFLNHCETLQSKTEKTVQNHLKNTDNSSKQSNISFISPFSQKEDNLFEIIRNKERNLPLPNWIIQFNLYTKHFQDEISLDLFCHLRNIELINIFVCPLSVRHFCSFRNTSFLNLMI